MADSHLILESLLSYTWLYSYGITFLPDACGNMVYSSVC